MTRETFNPVYAHIPTDVLQRIYEQTKRIGYEYVYVLRKSLHPDDDYLYVVIAQKKDKKEYAFWSAYNDCFHTLNHGHYGYTDFNKCFNDALEFVS